MTATKMSSRQYTMLGLFMESDQDIDVVRGLSQVTFGSLLYQKWVKQRANTKFEITREGRQARLSYGSADVARKNFMAALSRYVMNGHKTKGR